MAEVQYRGIAKNFGAVEVMRDLSLVINDGEFAVLLGASGCGKTTLLRMTAGLETVTEGDVLIDGVRVNDVHPRDRNIAMVFQNYALYPAMKVFDNIAFSLEIKGEGKAQIKKKVEEAAGILNLSDYLGRYPRELSGGQRQRVAMGRAMVRDAKVFLFDEPLSNLDAKLRAHMRVEIRQLHDRLGATTIYVTHDQIEAMTMADKIVLMKGGTIEQVGTPDELYDRPGTRFAADFIGVPAMNFIEGAIAMENAAPVFAAEGVRIPLASDCAARGGQRLICGLRPADLVLDDGGGIEGVLTLTEKTGAELNLYLSIAGRDLIATAPRDARIALGRTVRLSIPPANVHLFDESSNRRI